MRSRSPHTRGQSILEIVIYMVIAAVIAFAGISGYSVYVTDANGSACTLQLAQLDTADKSYCETHNVTLVGDIPDYSGSATTVALETYLGNKTINSHDAAGFACPGGGVYNPPTMFVTDTAIPLPPTCTLGTAAAGFSGTRFHALTTVAN